MFHPKSTIIACLEVCQRNPRCHPYLRTARSLRAQHLRSWAAPKHRVSATNVRLSIQAPTVHTVDQNVQTSCLPFLTRKQQESLQRLQEEATTAQNTFSQRPCTAEMRFPQSDSWHQLGSGRRRRHDGPPAAQVCEEHLLYSFHYRLP